ncbi:nucleoside-diphosphate sugar epimerase domain protein [Mycobacterium xenopi 4042]|uniref:Nucleoside-diphosphate sugar epimerase domain protein n=1 Tax=Mycobacterium xenopi 4042 TaxID=1299334 RepID=X8DJN4_MYCXE|nr:nucleoside-diphosphate sugar epimerase domain protein [Mycobacterium xenopi 4042]
MARLIPPWQPMTVLAEAESIADGRAVLGLPGGLQWVAQHRADEFEPPHKFVDVISSAGHGLGRRGWSVGGGTHMSSTTAATAPPWCATGSTPRCRARRSSPPSCIGIVSSPTIWPHTATPPSM